MILNFFAQRYNYELVGFRFLKKKNDPFATSIFDVRHPTSTIRLFSKIYLRFRPRYSLKNLAPGLTLLNLIKTQSLTN